MGFELRGLRMNKRGQEAATQGPGPIIAAVIGAIVLVLVIWGVWAISSGKLKPWAEQLPNPDENKPRIVNVEIVGYQIATDKARFYDGAAWNDCGVGSQIELNTKKVECNAIYNSFSNYFFSSKRIQDTVRTSVADAKGKPVAIDMKFQLARVKAGSAYSEPWYLRAAYWWEDKVRGEPYIISNGAVIIIANENGQTNNYVLQTDNVLVMPAKPGVYFRRFGQGTKIIEDPNSVEQTMRYDAYIWRDSFFDDKPIQFSYKNMADNDKVVSNYYCFRRINYLTDKYLTIDLTQPVEQNTDCSKAI